MDLQLIGFLVVFALVLLFHYHTRASRRYRFTYPNFVSGSVPLRTDPTKYTCALENFSYPSACGTAGTPDCCQSRYAGEANRYKWQGMSGDMFYKGCDIPGYIFPDGAVCIPTPDPSDHAQGDIANCEKVESGAYKYAGCVFPA